MDFVRKHANSVRLAMGTPGSNKSEGAGGNKGKKDCESPSPVEASRPDRKWFAVSPRGSGNQAVHATTEAVARPEAAAAAAAAAVAAPERQSTTEGRGTSEWGAATAKRRADSRGRKGRPYIGSEIWLAVGGQGIPVVVETRPSSSSDADSCGDEALWVVETAEARKGGNCSVSRGEEKWLLVENKHTLGLQISGDASGSSGSKKRQHLKVKEMAPASDRCSGGSGGSSGEKRSALDASKSWHGVGASGGGGSLQPVGSSSGAGERLLPADDDGGCSSGSESWATAFSIQSRKKSDTKSVAKPRKQPEKDTRPAAASAATGPPGKLPRTAANKAAKTTRLVAGKTKPKSNSEMALALAPQKGKTRGGEQAGQARAGNNVCRTPGDYPDDEWLPPLD